MKNTGNVASSTQPRATVLHSRIVLQLVLTIAVFLEKKSEPRMDTDKREFFCKKEKNGEARITQINTDFMKWKERRCLFARV